MIGEDSYYVISIVTYVHVKKTLTFNWCKKKKNRVLMLNRLCFPDIIDTQTIHYIMWGNINFMKVYFVNH